MSYKQIVPKQYKLHACYHKRLSTVVSQAIERRSKQIATQIHDKLQLVIFQWQASQN